jgi:RNA polymerase sigma-70 factor (ECF subfamily)
VPYPRGLGGRLEDDERDRIGVAAELNDLAATVQAARRGEREAWDMLFERFHPDVHAYALARLGDWASAEDVTQEVFVAAVGAVRRLRDAREPAVQAWFLHICRHKVADHLRRLSRRRNLAGRVASPGVDPEEIAVTRLDGSQLREALGCLTEDQRDILVRRFVLDQSLEQVAAGTRRTVGAVKALQHRALAAIERLLDGEVPR